MGEGSACAVRSANLIRAAHFDEVAQLSALDEPDGTLIRETTERLAGGASGDTGTAGERVDRKTDARLSFEEGVAEEMGVDSAIDMVEAKGGDENVFKLLPEECTVELFVVHGGVQEAGRHTEPKKRRGKPGATR